MKASRRLRSLVALLALFGVLFAQLAVSAYACPGSQTMAQASVEVEDMPGCDGMPSEGERSALCQAHCLQGDQSFDRLVLPAPGPAPPCTTPALVPVLAQVVESSPRGTQAPLLERRTEPSLAVRHCCLRI